MADKRPEINEDTEREERRKAFADALYNELKGLLKKPEHTEWLEDAITHSGGSEISYASHVVWCVGEFYDEHLKDKYGDRGKYPYVEGEKIEESGVSRESLISDVIDSLGYYISECAKTEINWDRIKDYIPKKQPELNGDTEREKRTKVFTNALSNELHKLFCDPQNQKWLTNVLDTNPYELYPYDNYDEYIAEYLREFDDEHLKDKYGDRHDDDYDEDDETEEFEFSKDCMITEVTNDLGRYLCECIETERNWDRL